MTAVKTKSAAKKRKKIVSLDKKKARAGWLFILPFIIGMVLILSAVFMLGKAEGKGDAQ